MSRGKWKAGWPGREDTHSVTWDRVGWGGVVWGGVGVVVAAAVVEVVAMVVQVCC